MTGILNGISGQINDQLGSTFSGEFGTLVAGILLLSIMGLAIYTFVKIVNHSKSGG